MGKVLKGTTVWKFADNFNADLIVGSKYIGERDPEILGSVCLAEFDAGFSKKAKPGDLMIAGKNFGYGHPHYQGIISLQKVGISVLLAESFYPLWYRVAIFYGFPVLVCPGISKKVDKDDEVEIDVKTGLIRNNTADKTIQGDGMHSILFEICESGGLVKHLQKKLSPEKQKPEQRG